MGDLGSIPGLGRSPGGGHGNPFQHFCLENPHGQRSLVGYSPWGHKELDTTEWLNTRHHNQLTLRNRSNLGRPDSTCWKVLNNEEEILPVDSNFSPRTRVPACHSWHHAPWTPDLPGQHPYSCKPIIYFIYIISSEVSSSSVEPWLIWTTSSECK